MAGAVFLMMTTWRHGRAILGERVRRVPFHERAEVEWLPEGFVRVVAHYGFMETPDMPALIARSDTPTPPMEYATFFMGTETLLPRGQQGMAPWREHLFAIMSRNALPVTAFFDVPADRVMEVGTQIVL